MAGEQREEESSALEERQPGVGAGGQGSSQVLPHTVGQHTAGARSSCSILVCAPGKHSEVYLVVVHIM